MYTSSMNTWKYSDNQFVHKLSNLKLHLRPLSGKSLKASEFRCVEARRYLVQTLAEGSVRAIINGYDSKTFWQPSIQRFFVSIPQSRSLQPSSFFMTKKKCLFPERLCSNWKVQPRHSFCFRCRAKRPTMKKLRTPAVLMRAESLDKISAHPIRKSLSRTLRRFPKK